MELHGLKTLPRKSLILFVVVATIIIFQLLFLIINNRKCNFFTLFTLLQLGALISLLASLWIIYQRGLSPQQSWHGMDGPGLGWV